MNVGQTELSVELFKGTADSNTSKTTIDKLKKNGIHYLEQLITKSPREIVDMTSVGIETANKLVMLAQKKTGLGFITGMDLLEQRKNIIKLTTGSIMFDKLLGGGIESQAITEFIGEFGAGKTQGCYTVAAEAIQVKPEEAEKYVVWIDTEQTFIPERFYQIAEARGYDPIYTLNHILVQQAYNSNHQRILTMALDGIASQYKLTLVIVDSMLSHFRSEYIGRATLAERQQTLNNLLGVLLKIAQGNNIPVLVTNQVQSDPSGAWGDPNKPAGGHVMAHACTVRVMMRKGKSGESVRGYSGRTIKAQVIDAPHLNDNKERVILTTAGLEDVKGIPEQVTLDMEIEEDEG